MSGRKGGNQGVREEDKWEGREDKAEEPWWDQIRGRVVVDVCCCQGGCITKRQFFCFPPCFVIYCDNGI